MNDGILDSTKKVLGIEADYEAFDQDIIMNINAAFMTLQQLGVGPEQGFAIAGEEETWSDFLQEGVCLSAVRQYIFIKTRLTFDPPTSSFVLEALERQVHELEWRLNVQADPEEANL